MDDKERVAQIRKGNELFNAGEIDKAAVIFISTRYLDGITRVADYWFYDKRQPLVALKYYKFVNRMDKVREINERMIFALGKMLGKNTGPKIELEPVNVPPKLKILAEEILRDNEEKEGE